MLLIIGTIRFDLIALMVVPDFGCNTGLLILLTKHINHQSSIVLYRLKLINVQGIFLGTG